MSLYPVDSIVLTITQLYFWTHSLSSVRYRNILAWIVGCMSDTPNHFNTTLIIPRQTQILSVRLLPLRPSTGAAPYRLWPLLV